MPPHCRAHTREHFTLILFLDTDLMRTPDSWAGEAVSGGSRCGTVRVRIHTQPFGLFKN